MSRPGLVRRPRPLDVRVRYKGSQVGEPLRLADIDPDIPGELRQVLLDFMERNHRRGPREIGDYDMQLWRPEQDKNPQRPWRIYTDIWRGK